MKAKTRLLAVVFILSMNLISCYPEKEILGHWPNGKIQDIRYHKRGYKWNERFVYYYDNGQKQYVRYWRNDLMQIYKMKAWYPNGAKRIEGWMKEKDTVRKYTSDSEFVFTGLEKEYARGWYQNGKLKFEIVTTKDHFAIVNYYDSLGARTRQVFIKELRPDGYDTIGFKTELESNGNSYTENIYQDDMPDFLSQE